jgi:hypothetical protein
LKGRSILNIVRAAYLELNGLNFDNNFVADSNTVYGYIFKANALLITDHYGTLVIKDSTF